MEVSTRCGLGCQGNSVGGVLRASRGRSGSALAPDAGLQHPAHRLDLPASP